MGHNRKSILRPNLRPKALVSLKKASPPPHPQYHDMVASCQFDPLANSIPMVNWNVSLRRILKHRKIVVMDQQVQETCIECQNIRRFNLYKERYVIILSHFHLMLYISTKPQDVRRNTRD